MTEQPAAAPLAPPQGGAATAVAQPDPRQEPPPQLTEDEFVKSLRKWQIQYHRHGVRVDSTPDQVMELAKADAGAAASAVKAIPISDPEVVVDAVSVKLVSGTEEGWMPVDDVGSPGEPGYIRGVGREFGEPDGRSIVWRVWVTENPETEAVEGVAREDGKIVVRVPEFQRRFGGVVRAMHRLGGTVKVYAESPDGQPIGYPWALVVDPDEAEVKVASDTGTLIIERT